MSGITAAQDAPIIQNNHYNTIFHQISEFECRFKVVEVAVKVIAYIAYVLFVAPWVFDIYRIYTNDSNAPIEPSLAESDLSLLPLELPNAPNSIAGVFANAGDDGIEFTETAAFRPGHMRKLREYIDHDGKLISMGAKGEKTGSLGSMLGIVDKNPLLQRELLQSVKIYDSLPSAFVKEFAELQNSSERITIPGIMNGGKKIATTVRDLLTANKKFNLENWKELGWIQQADYNEWLNFSVLEAFTGRVHYCEAPARFACIGKSASKKDRFVSLLPKGPITAAAIHNLPKLPIISIAGLELRGISFARKDDVLDIIKRTFPAIIINALQAAEQQDAQQLNLIPFGLGVFLGHFTHDAEVKNEILRCFGIGMRDYRGAAADGDSLQKVKFFGSPAQWKEVQATAPDLGDFLEHGVGDAYQDALYANQNETKAAMVNAGDGDWEYMIGNPGKTPGECWKGHTLAHTTSDESLALHTLFSRMGIPELMKHGMLDDSIEKI